MIQKRCRFSRRMFEIWWDIFFNLLFVCYLCELKHSDPMHMMTSSNGNIFPVTGPLCGELTGSRWIPLTKASFDVFFFICAWTNVWVNNRDAGDVRRCRAYYDVTVTTYWAGNRTQLKSLRYLAYLSFAKETLCVRNMIGTAARTVIWRLYSS